MKTKTKFLLLLVILMTGLIFNSCGKSKMQNTQHGDIISFYNVPLVCSAAPEIGCGSRIKPFFVDTKKENLIRESWSNRQGTIIAIVWEETVSDIKEQEKLIQPIFNKHGIDAKLISNDNEIKKLNTNFRSEGKWYKEIDIDKLSLEEAGVIAKNLTEFYFEKGLVNEKEASLIKNDLEEYLKKELVIVRMYDDLKNEETENRWKEDSFNIYEKYLGKERANKVYMAYKEYRYEQACKKTENACCNKDELKKDCCKKK